ncbi:MAG: thioredoxin family protein [Oculatellaceae cyanobacterium Prado106]|jgi:thiol-disulfide isomerase/thioredoxin|nr:thioredoxin family protein [Oculatellaceae cyanobacterium Prado106]
MTANSPSLAARFRNLVVVLVAIALTVALFFGLRLGTNSSSLEAMAASATPLEVALQSGKPTLMEFYANWCSACQAMAKDMHGLKQEYGDRVNFVMLNVDNTKWLPEMLNYRVDGIPHFVFLGKDGQAIASTIGEQPRSIMASNLDALSQEMPLPYVQNRGRVSEVETAVTTKSSQDDPRSHGAQVKTGS